MSQELFVFTLTREGRAEVINYPTVSLPTGMDVPLYVADRFGDFYTALFDRAVARGDQRVVFLEYAWDMAWCDPCAADPLSVRQLLDLGAFWLKGADENGMARDVYLTRLHLRYDSETFPDDLMFRVSDNRENFQGRYVIRHPWSGAATCSEAVSYLRSLPYRFEQEAQTLSHLTGWPISEVRDDMAASSQRVSDPN